MMGPLRVIDRRVRATILASVLGLTLLSSDGNAASEQLAADAVLSGVQQWLDDTQDLQGRFEQRLDSGVFGDAVTESGRIWIARPGRMRWEYQQPEPKLAIVRDTQTWLYLEEDRQVQLGLLDEDTRLLPTLLAGEGRLSELFTPSLVETEASDGVYRLRLTPKSDSGAFEEVVVTTAAPDFAVDAVEVLDAVGNRGSYEFSRIRRNRGLTDDLFRFESPPDVEIVGTHER
jgi:outer membrane lipoprotein carrier protein